MRLLLVLLLVHGLTPALGEVAEAVVHLAATGHLAHSDADHGDLGDQGDEHGCGTTQHQCGCCASQVLAAAPVVEVRGAPALAVRHAPPSQWLASLHEPSPPQRPPIASDA
ncbi:MAG: hypothetical protein IPO09_01800 [Anaeromyxobacter sp.]|nr:hypothetical protein [Anaeromyxobacter sp.]MBL0278106.1 hypothetical protein [Anaeromyxobacter sp.]